MEKIVQQKGKIDGLQVTKMHENSGVKDINRIRKKDAAMRERIPAGAISMQVLHMKIANLYLTLNLKCIQLEIIIYDIKNKAQLELNRLLVNLSDFLQTYFCSIYLTSTFNQCIINFPKITVNFYDIITSNLFYHPCIDRQYNVFCTFWQFLSHFIGFKIVLIHFNFDVHFLKFSHY